MFGQFGFKWEPTAIAEAIRLVLIAFALSGAIHLDDKVILAIVGAVSAVLSLFVRQSVTSQNTLEKAGTSQAAVVKAADDKDRSDRGLEPPIAPRNLMMLLLAVGLAGSMAVGCALHGKPPERQVAIIALQVTSGVDAVAKTSQELHAAKVLTDDQYKVVLLRLREVYLQTSRLADALKAYDTVASTDAASQVTAALNALAVLVPNLAADLTGPGGQKIAALVGEVNKLLIAIAQAVRPPTARVHVELQPVGGAL
jgi:hypothetical protein